MSATGFFESDHEEVQRVSGAYADAQKDLEAAYERWEELEENS